MNKFSWLHLTDLHIGMRSQDHLWPNIREAFFKDLAVMHERNGPWHAVFFTGDLVQSGLETEFDRLEQLLISLWERFRDLGSKPLLFAVPGNHDLIRPEAKISAVRLLSKWNDNPEIHEELWSDSTSEYRKIVDTAFANYVQWRTASSLKPESQRAGLLPGDFSSVVELDGFRVGVVGLNTAFLQLTGGRYEERLAWDVRQFHEACGGDGSAWSKQNNVSILLSHHGLDWLNEHSRAKVSAEIAPAGRFAVHMFGHMHVSKMVEEAEGGGPFRRLWQGKSLFGLEHYGPEKAERLHGYSLGEISSDGAEVSLRRWPRSARLHPKNGWEMIPDHESFSLSADEGTQARIIELAVDKSRTDRSHAGTSIRKAGSIGAQESATPRSAKRSTVGGKRQWNWPSGESALRPYCEAVCKAHSHIRFVEIPYLKDVTDVELDNLFVDPKVSSHEIHPDQPLYAWPKCFEVLDVLAEHPQLVLLGDPGSGKSTLVSCLSWQLCRPKPLVHNAWGAKFGGCVPLPMILRELSLKADLTWEGLTGAFLEHRIGRLLQNKKTLESLLKDGRAIVLLDGLDEIGNLTVRRKLRAAVHTGMAAFPKTRWIMTSRIVGYEQVPFHYKIESRTGESVTTQKVVEHTKRSKRVRTRMSDVFYQSPFDDEQIRSFSVNWYSQHEQEKELISSNAEDFVQAIRENEGTQRLARIPYLLTLMALVHHKHAQLPHGRTELYERIATAYLESIDLRRQLTQLPYSLAQKKRWLADVAYRMQLRRVKRGSEASQGDLLATKIDVQKWLRSAMVESGTRDSKDESEALLKYFAQRSGLLVPRGEGKFAFMHLSLQEYFAASFLEPRLTSSRFSPKTQKLEPTNEQLRNWVNSDAWRETFVLLFELLSAKSTIETEAFLDYLFKRRLEMDTKDRESTAAALLAEIVTDPFVVLTSETGRKMRQLCWRWVLGHAKKGVTSFWRRRSATVLRSLLRETQGDLRLAWKAASIAQSELQAVPQLDLSGCTSLCDLRPLLHLRKLKELNLRECTSIQDLTPIAGLKQLKELSIEGCTKVPDLKALAGLKHLSMLVVGSRFDLTPLSKLSSLQQLHLHYDSPVDTDLTPIAGLLELRSICTLRNRSVRVADQLMKNPERIASPGIRRLFRNILAKKNNERNNSAATSRSRRSRFVSRRKK